MNLPATTEKEQIGTNKCGTKASQSSMWYVLRRALSSLAHSSLAKTSLSTRSMVSAPPMPLFPVLTSCCADFCLWAPPYSDGHNSSVGQVEEIMVAWCLNDGYGTRLIPDGTIKVGLSSLCV